MPSKVHLLPDSIIAQISAGEVVESPVSALKELIENSIDAEATEIEVIIEEEGFKQLQIRDNGIGIYKDDLSLVLKNFTTSKLSSINDLYNLYSLGFRGEALASIASISNISIESKSKIDTQAWKVETKSGVLSQIELSTLEIGTRIIVSDLFYNAPIRKDFQKNTLSLKKGFHDLIIDFALSYPHITFRYVLDNVVLVRVKATDHLSKRIHDIFLNESTTSYVNNLQPIYFKKDNWEIEGYISNFSFYKNNASMIRFFVNQRIVSYKPLVGLFKRGYGELMPPGRFPIAFLFLKLSPNQIDINIHPQKKEIRFKHETEVSQFILEAILNAIEKKPLNIKILNNLSKNTDRKKSDIYTPSQLPNTLNLLHTIETEIQEISDVKNNATDVINIDHSAQTNNLKSNFIFPNNFHVKIYNTFILASSEEGIFLIDQHTLHERINYENFLTKLATQDHITQTLISPLITTFSLSELSILREKKEVIEDLGFIIEDLGPAGLTITSVPFYLQNGQEEEAIKIILDHFQNTNKDFSKIELFKMMAASLSCREAIKKGDPESIAVIQELVERLKKCDNPARCPHGRPTFVFLGKEDIFKLFKR